MANTSKFSVTTIPYQVLTILPFFLMPKHDKFDNYTLVIDSHLLVTGQDGGKRMGLNFDRVKYVTLYFQ